jgi:hypothetical protein
MADDTTPSPGTPAPPPGARDETRATPSDDARDETHATPPPDARDEKRATFPDAHDETRVPSAAGDRYTLVSTWRFVVPLAVVLGVLGAVAGGGVLRWVCGIGAVLIALLWLVGAMRRPELVLEAGGYRVEEGGRERLRVDFTEVRRARAVPAEHAMYVDCGDPRRNLLLPPRRGYGFRFDRQSELYVRLARALGDRVEIVDRLEARPAPRQ